MIQTGAPAQLSAVDAVLDKVPFRILESNDEVTITTEFNEVRHNVDIDREKFVKPGR